MHTPITRRAAFRSRRLVALGALCLGASACRDSSGPPAISAPLLMRITCTGTATGISCAPESQSEQARASGSGLSLDRVIGGQNTFVRLAQTSASFNSTTNQLSSNVTVRNLIDQPMGTADGTTLDANAVRVFFHTPPTNGVSIVNEDGSATFTASNQEFFRYNEIIPAGATSSPRTWIFQLPSPSTTFSFQVYVAARLPNEAAPADVAELGTQLLLSGLTAPVYLTAPAGDSRLFIVGQNGVIRVYKNGALLSTPFLNITSRVSYGGEGGLLSMAFDPNYATNGFFYVYLTNVAGDIAIERYFATPGSDVANTTATTVLTVPHPGASNHNGGLIMFGPDGRLYAATGDGGGSGDPEGDAQNPNSRLGKVLRINVSAQPFTTEVWARGLRNPWRFDFHTWSSGRTDLYIADVGQNAYEEVNVAIGNPSGLNYGWNIVEGNHCYPSLTPCAPAGLHVPSMVYDHSQGCSITGGFVYRGSAIPFLSGQYLYSDYCSGFLRSLSVNSNSGFSENRWTFTSVGNVVSFGEDSAGELYLIGRNSIWKIVRK